MIELGIPRSEEMNPAKPHIGVLYAGGTISSIQTSDGSRAGGQVRELIDILQDTFPDYVAGRFTLGHPRVAYTGLSENIVEQDRKQITEVIDSMVDSGLYTSIVVTHGTDSMELTAKYIKKHESLFKKIKNKGIKIIITGAEDDIDAPNTDVWDNLKDSLNEAAAPGEGNVFVVFHKRVIPEEFIVKQPYSGTNGFNFMDIRSDEFRNALDVAEERSFNLANTLHQHLYGRSLIDVADEEDRRIRNVQTGVELSVQELEDFALMDVMDEPLQSVFEYRVDFDRPNHADTVALNWEWAFPDLKAILLILYHSGTANTNDPNSTVTSVIEGLRETKGIASFAVTENYEPVDLHAYETSVALRNAGVVPLYDIPYHAALIKLKWAKEQTDDPAEIIDIMLTNMVGELDERRVHQEDIDELKRQYTKSFENIQKANNVQEKEAIFWRSFAGN